MRFGHDPKPDTVTRWEEPRVPEPDMTKMVSLGEHVRVGERFNGSGREIVAQKCELFCEWTHGGGTNRYWHRYPGDNTLYPQFDTEPTDRVVREEPLSEGEKAVHRALWPFTPRPTPEPDTITPAFERPQW
jgi:hypothetical protein